jgi:hypothetical protein
MGAHVLARDSVLRVGNITSDGRRCDEPSADSRNRLDVRLAGGRLTLAPSRITATLSSRLFCPTVNPATRSRKIRLRRG